MELGTCVETFREAQLVVGFVNDNEALWTELRDLRLEFRALFIRKFFDAT